MQVSVKDARTYKSEVWLTIYSKKIRILPRKVFKITKKFIYFDESNDKDKVGTWEVKDYYEQYGGLFTSESEAWKFVLNKCHTNLDYAKAVINDYEFIKHEHPEVII